MAEEIITSKDLAFILWKKKAKLKGIDLSINKGVKYLQ